jgi:branched-chain amino acid transport system permease protein
MLRWLGGRRGWVALGIVALLFILVPPVSILANNTYYVSKMVIIGIHTMITVGLCLLMGYAGQVSLGQAAFYGMGAFISAILSGTYGLSPWLALVAAAAVTGGLAYLISFPIFRLRGNYLAMATLGFGLIIYILFVELSDFTGGPSGLSGVPYLSIGGFVFDNDIKYYYLVWAVCLAVLLLSQNIVRSRIGRALRSIHSSEVASESLGVNVAQFKTKVFVLSAVYASLAGSLYAHYVTFVSPQPFGFLFSVQLVVMAVLGGLASIWGSIFGAGTISLLTDLLHGFGELDVIVFGLILIVVMIFMPQGLTRGLGDMYQRLTFRAKGGRSES